MNKHRIQRLLLLFIASLFFLTLDSYAEVRLPAILGNHMVLQQNSHVKLWGWCDAAENIKISTSWDTIGYQTTGSPMAKWSLEIHTPKAGGPYTIIIEGNNTIVIEDILIGEVWACSGQSNMEMSYNWLQNWGSNRYQEEVESGANNYMRFFHIPKLTADYPQDDTKGKWVVCSPAEIKSVSLVAFFFGSKLQKELNTPVGLIHASWGGTPAEVWAPKDSIEHNIQLKQAADRLSPSKWWTVKPGSAYNAMIHPIKNYTLAGALWYQGEANVSTAASYAPLLKTMINSWRTAWNKNLPFYYVQIAPYAGYGKSISSAILREQQTRVLQTPNTGMIVIHDLVEDINDIHPRNKRDVAHRLANLALADTYKKNAFSAKSPLFKHMMLEKNKIRIYFSNADQGLKSKGVIVKDFYISGEDKVFKPADAKIEGSSVIISHPHIRSPIAVRFGFTNAAMPNLFNKEGLPVNIFRTDNWDSINTLP